MKFKKLKLAAASLLAVCCLGTAAVGAALTATPVAAAGVLWDGMGGEMTGDVTVSHSAISTRSTVDIMKLPNQTGVFYMYYSDSGAGGVWSGFSFRNGNTGVGYPWTLENCSQTDFPWHTIGFQEEKHMIFQDNRNFTGGTLGGINGAENAAFMDGMIPVEIHIGEGTAQGDPSYIKVGGKELMQEDDVTKAITQPWTRAAGTSKELVASMFPQGCYVTVNHNFGAAAVHDIALSNVGSVVGLNASMDMTKIEQAGAFSKDLTVDLSSATEIFQDGYTVTARVNGHELADAVTVEKTDNTHAKATISKEKLDAIPAEQLSSKSYFIFEVKNGATSYGSAAVGVKVAFENPPTFEITDVKLTEKKEFSYEFTYSGTFCNPVTDAELTYRYSSSGDLLSLTRGTEFTVTKGQQDKYTLTITQAAAEKLFNGHASVTLFAQIGPGDPIRLTAFVDGQTNEYGVRFRSGIDYVDGTLEQNEIYSSATLKKHDPVLLSSRVFYENAISVSEPIVIQFGYIPAGVEWMLVSVMNDPAICENFTETTPPSLGNTFSFIMFGPEANGGTPGIQGMNGSLTNGNTIACSAQSRQKDNVLEIFFGATDPNAGYVKLNGVELGAKPTVTQAAFSEGNAHIGFFFNNGPHEIEFTCNTHLNAVAVTDTKADKDYAMDLGKAQDFTLTLGNTSGKLKLYDETGKELPAAQYSYADNKLTVKAEYFSTKVFAREGQIYIWDTEKQTGTSFRMSYTNSATEPAHITYLTKGNLQDVVFDLGISGVEYVLKGGENLASDSYSIADGKLTVKSSAIDDTIGLQEILVGSPDGKLYPCYIYVNTWQDGYAKEGDGTLAYADGTYTLSGKLSFDEMKSYDLTQGVTFGVDFSTIDGYHMRGLNTEDHTCITFKFYDPGKKYTFVITLYPNYPDDKISTSNEALYLRYLVLDENGATVSGSNKTSTVPAASASGRHNLTLKTNDKGGIDITYAGFEFDISATVLNGFNTSNCVLTVDTAKTYASTADSAVKVTIESGVKVDDVYTGEGPSGSGGQEGPSGGQGEEEGGCGGVIAGSGMLLVAALGAACAALLRKKKEQ